MTPQKLEWWHEVQEAYADNDAERLEVILNLIEMSEGEPTAQTSVSLLQRIIARLKASLREIKREVTARKRDPAWNFTTRGDREVLAARVNRELALQLEHLHRAYAADELLLRRYAADARRHTERLEARAKKTAPKRPPPPARSRRRARTSSISSPRFPAPARPGEPAASFSKLRRRAVSTYLPPTLSPLPRSVGLRCGRGRPHSKTLPRRVIWRASVLECANPSALSHREATGSLDRKPLRGHDRRVVR